jgi:uncharacterized iron-regulated protein
MPSFPFARQHARAQPFAVVPVLLVLALAALLPSGCATSADRDPAAQLAAALTSQPVVLLGEVHDNAAQHALRAEALRRWLDTGARPALLMEQFDRERQQAIDAALARPGADVETVIEAGAPDAAARRGWDWRFYRPYIALALEFRLPLLAANVSRSDARAAAQSGLASLGFDPVVPADIAAAQAQAIVDGHCGAIDAVQAAPLVASQVARDQFMAQLLQDHAARGAVVLLAGNGHVRRDIGVPRWLAPSVRARSLAIGLLEAPAANDGPAPYDLAIATAAQPRDDPCAALRAGAPVAR